MTLILLSFIGIAINIWKDTAGTGGGGGGGVPTGAILERDSDPILDRAGAYILVR